jgi:hypothetical protein
MMLPDLYWLCRCEGWQVLSPEGRVGRVARILFGSNPNAPEALAVRTGLFRTKELILPATEVATVDRDRKRLLLHADAAWSEFPAILEARRAPAEQGIAAG